MIQSRMTFFVGLVMMAAACTRGGGGGGAGNEKPGGASPPAAPPPTSPPPEDPHNLAPLARRIVQRVSALGARFPSMQGAKPELRQIYSLDTSSIPWWARFEARWDHEHGVSWEPDPTYDPIPHSARSPNRSKLDPQNGMQLTMWLYEGAWLQLMPVTPFEIGRLRVVTFLSAPSEELRKGLQAAINEILESERAAAAATP